MAPRPGWASAWALSSRLSLQIRVDYTTIGRYMGVNRERPRRATLIGSLFATFLVIGATSLVLLVGVHPRGIVYGRIHTCDASVIVNNDACYSRIRYEPVQGFKLRFVGIGDSPIFIGTTSTATTDADGYYSISLPVGHYLIPGYFDGGPRALDVIAGKKAEADFQLWRLPQ